MRKNNKTTVLFLATICIFLTIKPMFACTCVSGVNPPCVAYENAYVVFIGKLKSKTDLINTSEASPFLFGFFEVEKAFKGDIGKKVKLKMSGGDCDLGFQVGESYFIYAHQSRTDNSLEIKVCDRSTQIKNADSDIKYVNSLSSLSSYQSIMGEITGLSPEELKNIKVTIESKSKRNEYQVKSNGMFDVSEKKIGRFKVLIEFPPELEISVIGKFDGNIETDDLRTVVTYDVLLAKNKCDYKVFTVKKQD
jgi:hypothetical protein